MENDLDHLDHEELEVPHFPITARYLSTPPHVAMKVTLILRARCPISPTLTARYLSTPTRLAMRQQRTTSTVASTCPHRSPSF